MAEILMKDLTVTTKEGNTNTYIFGDPITDTISKSAIASFTDGADGYPVKDLKAYIEPVQSGSGDPSPSNVRPITGWTGMNVVVSPTLDAQDGTTYPISWADDAGTVYGGYLDVTSGVLTVTQEILTINDVSWNYYAPSSGNPYFYHTEPTKASVPVGSSENPLICSILPYGGSNYASQFTDGKIWQAANTNIYIVDTSVTTVSAMKTKYGTGTVVYPLATPQTYQLTPQAVMTILGQNNIWADTGDVEVEYCADTKLYINKVLNA